MTTATTEITPTVGMGVSEYGYSDVNPGTITRVSASGKRIWFKRDNAVLLNGVNSGEPDALKFSAGGFVGHTSGQQRWEITPNPDAPEQSATLRSDGLFHMVGTKSGPSLTIGKRIKHYDFNF